MPFSKEALLVLLCLCVSPLDAQQSSAARKNPFTGNAAAVNSGKKAYESSCRLCHGGDGRGGRGPALATGRFQHGGED